MGIVRPNVGLNASFASEMPVAGNLAFVSQSGAICTAILDLALKERIGFSHFVSIGSMLDVDFGDMIDYLGNAPSAKSILLYIESLTNFRKFMSAARSVSRLKPHHRPQIRQKALRVRRPPPPTQGPWPEKMRYTTPPSSAPASCAWTPSKNSSTARS